jgi:acyl-CoA synthetase (AMP-forming)/AMP-acid ligase II
MGAAFYVGMRVALEDDFGSENFLKTVQRESVTHCALLPSMWNDLLSNYPHGNYELDSLEVVLMGSEPLLPSLLKRIKERLPNTGLYSYYGQTETPYTCLGRLDDGSQGLDVAGRPRIMCAVRIVDPTGNRVVEQAGEITIRGPHILTEYYGQPEKTAETSVDGWFCTGDLGIQDASGYVRVLGRREDAIQRGDRFVRPVEVEDVALSIDGVGEAGAVGVQVGSEHQKILLAVSPAAGKSLDEAQLQRQLSERLPEHAQIDKLVIVDELPHGNDASGGKGKLLRRVIRELYGNSLSES